jgi:hypothetical protein
MPSSSWFRKWTPLIFAPALLHAGDGRPRYYNALSGEVSPKRDIAIEYYRSDGAGSDTPAHQIWLVSPTDPGKRRLLFTHWRDASILFSEDEKWLVINDRQASNESHLLLYCRKAELEYEQVVDLSDAAWHFFDEKQRQNWKSGFDHHYVEALRWAEHGAPTLLLVMRGHADSRNYTSDWYCLYEVEAKTFSTDLDAHNRRNTKVEIE